MRRDSGGGRSSVSNKKHRNRDAQAPTAGSSRNRILTLVGGALLVVLFIFVGIAIVTLLGGDDLSKEDPKAPDLPALGALPDAPRSAVADLLENGSFDTMSAEDKAKVAAEVARIFGDANLRASSTVIPGLDVASRNGRIRASRQYKVSAENAGDQLLLTTTTVFYCDGPNGTFDLYRLDDTGVERKTTYTKESSASPPFQRLFASADWSKAKDLGFREVSGRRVHGVQLTYTSSDSTSVVEAEQWYDVENARLLYHRSVNVDPGDGYFFDWRTPPPITVPEEMATPPCAGEVTGD
jgi:hypothetical protein